MRNKTVTRLLIKMLSPVVGRRIFQKQFEILHQFALFGMNIGAGANPKWSGEKNTLRYIHTFFKNTQEVVIFDVGANAGHYTVLAKEVFGDKAIVYSFEPSLHTFRKLTQNAAGKNRVKLHNFGLGDVNGKALLFSNSSGSGLASVYDRRLEHYDIKMNIHEEVTIKTLDSFCSEQGIDHIHFLKLDVEGHEMKVLSGGAKMLEAGAIDFIQFEFGGCNIDSRTYFQDFFYLLHDKYTIYRIVKDGIYPIERYKEQYEAFNTTNYLAQKK